MKTIGAVVMLALLSASCRQQPHAPDAQRRTVRQAGCADRLEYALSRTSFASNGANGIFPEPRLADFKAKAAKAFRSAADDLCRTRQLKPDAFSRTRRVVIETASGAMEPLVFQDEVFGRDTLVFQWVFAEADLAVPDGKAIRQGLLCWDNPDRAECAAEGD